MNISNYANILPASGRQVRIMKRHFFEKLGIKSNYNSRHELAALFQMLLYMFGNHRTLPECPILLNVPEMKLLAQITHAGNRISYIYIPTRPLGQ